MKKLVLVILGSIIIQAAWSQTALNLASLPLQISVNEGTPAIYTFDAPITSIEARNLGVVNWTINGNEVTLTGVKPGRTGLKIVANSKSYFIGVRSNKANGNKPGLPAYLSIGSVSEDLAGDLSFWQDVNPGAKNKSMDIRYIYINGGAIGGWQSWGPKRPGDFARQSLKHGLIPFFVYYNIPDNGESYELDLKHVQDPAYMTAYFKDINAFMDSVQNVMKGELYGIILEPDFLGYMQQNAKPNDPLTIATAVNETTIAANAGNITTLVQRINKTIQDKRNSGHNIFFGWQLNLWAFPDHQGSKGVLRQTDNYTLPAAQFLIERTARMATSYAMAAGIFSNGADFVSIDKYGQDAMGHINDADPSKSTWFFNNDHWKNYLLYVSTMHKTSGKPVVLWQLPVGRINGSTYVSAYTNAKYPDLNNTSTKYEDSSTDFFLGDDFTTSDALRLNYFNQNKWNDKKVSQSGNTISWKDHMQECKDAGIISFLFGAGVNSSTDGVGSPPSDNYFWVQKVQDYYNRRPIPLDETFADGDLNPCTAGCPPKVYFITPQNGQKIVRSSLDTVLISFTAWDIDGKIATLTATIDGVAITTKVAATVQNIIWAPPTAWGNHTLTVVATDNSGKTTTASITFLLEKMDAANCGFPEWSAATTYAQTGTKVSYNGLIYKNKWYSINNLPYLGGTDSPWELEGVCPQNTSGVKGNMEQELLSVNIFPNPASGYFQVLLKSAKSGTLIQLLDVTGKIIEQKNATEATTLLTMGNHSLKPGIYFLKVANNETTKTQRIVIF